MSTSSILASQGEPPIQSNDIGSEGYRPPDEPLVGPETGPPGALEQLQGSDEDELQLPSDAMTADEEMALLQGISKSKIKWGAVPARPDMLEGLLLDDGEVVLHLAFGPEEHNVEPPCEHRLYI